MRSLVIVCAAAAAAVLTMHACGPAEKDARAGASPAELAPLPLAALPEAATCAACHAAEVRKWLQHGMADALGPLDPARTQARPDAAWRVHAASGARYRVEPSAAGGWILAQEWADTPADLPPPRREIALAGRIGAGVHDTAFAALEQDAWFFAPLEFLRGRGWVEAPFQQAGAGSGLQFRLTPDCLACHTDAPLPAPFPYHKMGPLALRGISCAACHGDGAAHARDGKAPILDPGTLPAERQLDLCARCHLEGDARIEVAPPEAPPWRPGDDLLARRAVLVPRSPGDAIHFVSQVQRLTLSACFRATPDMSCVSCHDPHLPSRLESRERLTGACAACHRDLQHPATPGGADGDCVSCHMPRVEPFDLPGVAVADHWIRRRPRAPAAGPFRDLEAPDGNWEEFRYRATDPPRWTAREVAAFAAMTLADAGRHAEALRRFAVWDEPAAEAAPARPWDPARLAMLDFMRGVALGGVGRRAEAAAAYGRALARAPDFAEARLNQGLLLLESGDAAGALAAAEILTAAHPRAESAWLLAAAAHAAAGRQQEAGAALERSLAAYGAQALVLQRLGRAAAAARDFAAARRALFAAWSLDPRLPGLADELRQLR